MLVLDASMTFAWIFTRAKSAEVKSAGMALTAIAELNTAVPALWHTEIATSCWWVSAKK